MTLDSEGMFTDSPTSITTRSGIKFNPYNARLVDIRIEDIAGALARQCRYNGHVGGYLSVARHCVWVAEHIAAIGLGQQQQLEGLLHDAAEAYLGDIIRPLKHSEMGDIYREVERGLEMRIANRFGLGYPFGDFVGAADTYVLLHLEMGGPKYRDHWDTTPDQDEHAFLEWYYHLTGE